MGTRGTVGTVGTAERVGQLGQLGQLGQVDCGLRIMNYQFPADSITDFKSQISNNESVAHCKDPIKKLDQRICSMCSVVFGGQNPKNPPCPPGRWPHLFHKKGSFFGTNGTVGQVGQVGHGTACDAANGCKLLYMGELWKY